MAISTIETGEIGRKLLELFSKIDFRVLKKAKCECCGQFSGFWTKIFPNPQEHLPSQYDSSRNLAIKS